MDFEISVEVLEEAGYQSALFGVALNKDQKVDNMVRVCERLAPHDGGHNKFLEHIMVWLNVRAPRYIWQEMDTFRLSSKNSQSTMHTILKDKLTPTNFECELILPRYLTHLNAILADNDLVKLKRALPEGFMQRRMWTMSYKTLRNIILQRRTHRLPHWRNFIGTILAQVEHPELLPTLEIPKKESI